MLFAKISTWSNFAWKCAGGEGLEDYYSRLGWRLIGRWPAAMRLGHTDTMNFSHWWDQRVVPRLVDLALSERVTGGWREGVAGSLRGDVLELGFGSGSNLSHYGAHVERVLAVEPVDLAWEKAERHIEQFGRPVQRIGLDGASLSIEDSIVDHVVSTWTMCTIPNLAGALSEVRRVLKPGGRLHFVEHSLSPSSRVSRVQRQLQPVWRSVAGGCHLDRDIPHELRAAGLEISDLHARYASPLWPSRPFGWFVTGTAIPSES